MSIDEKKYPPDGHSTAARKLYLRLVKHYHPDLARPGQCEPFTALMQQINSAWDEGDIATLREIEAKGVDFLAWQESATQKRREIEAAERARNRSEAIWREFARQAEAAAAKARVPAYEEPPRRAADWGRRPDFSHITGVDGVFVMLVKLLNFWGPCSNWVVAGPYYRLLRWLMQLSILSAWVWLGIYLCEGMQEWKAGDEIFLRLVIGLGQAVSLAVVAIAGTPLFCYAVKPVGLLLGLLGCAWLASWSLHLVIWGEFAVYGAAMGTWIYRICIDQE